MPSQWLQVLQIVQKGVFAEFESRYERLIEPLIIASRFEDPAVRSEVLRRFVNFTASIDLPYMRELALNMVSGVLASDPESLPDAGLQNRMRDFLLDIETHLSQDIVDCKIKELSESAKRQGQELVWRNRNPEVQKEIEEEEAAARERRLLVDASDENSDAVVSKSIIDKEK